jgi:shikimate kinase
MNVYLAGMIGAGKTTLGRRIARHLDWPFDDLDPAMERLAGKDFRRVVAEDGWLRFRQWEYRICKEFARMDRTVIALGGGTVRYEWNRDVLRGTGVVILLTANLDELAHRVRANDRPRVNPGTALEEDLDRIWRTHQNLYYAFADIVYQTGRGKTVEEEVEALMQILARDFAIGKEAAR